MGGNRYSFSCTFATVKIVDVVNNSFVKDSVFRETGKYEYPQEIESFIDSTFAEGKPLPEKYKIINNNTGHLVFDREEKTAPGLFKIGVATHDIRF